MNVELICLNEDKLSKITNYEETMMFSEEIVFVLVVDNVPVVDYRVILQKYNGNALGVSCAEIQYSNRFYNSANQEEKEMYLGKGYAKTGLHMLLENLANYNIPYVHLDINEDNIGSIKIAEANGLKKYHNSYYQFHSNARELFEMSLGDKLPKEVIMKRFDDLMISCGIDIEKRNL